MINLNNVITQKSLTSTALTEDTNETVIQSFRAGHYLFYGDALFSQVVIDEAGEKIMPNILVNWSLYLRKGRTVNLVSAGMAATNPLVSVSKGTTFPNAVSRFKIQSGHEIILETRTINSGTRTVTVLATVLYGIVVEESVLSEKLNKVNEGVAVVSAEIKTITELKNYQRVEKYPNRRRIIK